MLERLQNAILNRTLIRIRMIDTPENNWITIEPHLIIHNILRVQNRLLMYITNHWMGNVHAGWRDIALDSIVEIAETAENFQDRNPKPVNWQLHDQVFPPID